MKFTQRLVILTFVIVGALLLSTSINVLVLWKSDILTTKDDDPLERGGFNENPAFLRGDHKPEAASKKVNEVEEDWKSVEEMRETLDILKGHLAVMRKDLDFSNASVREISKHVGSSQLLYKNLKRDPNFLKGNHKNTLLKLARLFLDQDEGSKNIRPPHFEDEESNNVPQNPNSKASSPTRRPPPEPTKDDNHMVTVTLTKDMLDQLHEAADKALKKRKKKKKGLTLTTIHRGSKLAAWQKFHNGINQFELYGQTDRAVDQLLQDLSYKTVVGLHEIGDLGTQIKLVLKLNYGGKALFKPMRFSKDAEADPNHYIFDDFERHHAEIAAFHLDRVLNFRRVPPVSGRYVNLTRDLERHASNKLRKTFFWSPVKNRCFYGICDTYCDSGQAVCGHPYMVEGSLAVWLPEGSAVKRKHWPNPWAQTYSMKHDTAWRNDTKYCSRVLATPPYNQGRRLLDVMDMAIFDFLAGNMDRHHYHTFDIFGNYTFLLLFDNGRAFGRPLHDELGLLAAVNQCCLIRATTLKHLLSLHNGPDRLSEAMRQSLAKDVLSPVLNDLHLAALDRRLAYVLETVYNCGTKVKPGQWDRVVLNDGF